MNGKGRVFVNGSKQFEGEGSTEVFAYFECGSCKGRFMADLKMGFVLNCPYCEARVSGEVIEIKESENVGGSENEKI